MDNNQSKFTTNSTNNDISSNSKNTQTHTKFINSIKQLIQRCPNQIQIISKLIIQSISQKNLSNLQNITEKGIPDDIPILRAFVWKILLKYLPINIYEWDSFLLKKRNEYKTFIKLIESKLEKEISNKDYKTKDLLEQIIKDVSRTSFELSFFFQSTNKITLSPSEITELYNKRKYNSKIIDIKEFYSPFISQENKTHADILKRILLIFSILRPDIGYHQGMNEILAPIYYCYSYDKLYENEKEEDIEADSFWSFFNLMSQLEKTFNNDETQQGLYLLKEILEKCLKIVDENIFIILQEKNVQLEFFCFRWFILLFSQEFNIGDIMKLWDLIFSNENKYYYLIYISIAFLLIKKNIIIEKETIDILEEFQNFGNVDIDLLINNSRNLKVKFGKILDEIIVKNFLVD